MHSINSNKMLCVKSSLDVTNSSSSFEDDSPNPETNILG